jgi:pyruvate/2-oxoglutarate dehydrogenase complex dihydrolipoamide dehydrogenase (E3) component
VAAILREDGVEVLLGSAARRVAPAGAGVELTVAGKGGERTLVGSHLLVATGRTPNSDRLNLGAAGVAADRHGNIQVDERLATTVPGIYAAGDIKGGPAFTHISYDDYRILKANLIDGGDRTTAGRLVPYTVYIDPQLGKVGLGEEEARAQGRDIKVLTMPMSSVARAVEVDETRGLMKAVVDGASGKILGFAMLGIEGGEIMSAVQLAMQGGLPATALRDGVFAHPTLAEALNNLFAQL